MDTSSPLIVEKNGFLIEDGNDGVTGLVAPALENPDYDIAWYRNYFVGNDHQNYIHKDSDIGAMIVSVMREDDGQQAQYRIIVLTKKQNYRVMVPAERRKKISLAELMRAVKPAWERMARRLIKVSNVSLYKEILDIEDLQTSSKYKFGVLLALEGQTDEEDMFSNEHSTPAFAEFLSYLGDRIELQDWPHYRAGLDTKFGGTGTHSYYRQIHGCEVMFHVSTELPYTSFNRQQLQRKRQCGNDVIQIVFIDGEADPPFDPECIASHFNHVWCVVQKSGSGKSGTHYKVWLARKECVPFFGPPLPNPPIFAAGDSFGEFLLTKLINGERSAMVSETFTQLHERTKEIMLTNIYDTYRSNTSSDKSKEQQILRQLEEAMAKNPIQHERRVPNIFDCMPVLDDFPAINAVDTWGDRLVVATDDGLFVMPSDNAMGADAEHALQGMTISKLKVFPEIGVLVVVAGKKAESYSINLGSLADAVATTSASASSGGGGSSGGSGASASIPVKLGVRRVTLVATSEANTANQTLLCLAAGKNLSVLRWEGGDEGWVTVNEYVLPAEALSLEFFGRHFLCVGFRYEFDLLDLQTSSMTELYRSPDKTSPVAICRAADELLLCFDHYGVFVDVRGKPSDVTFEWTTAPRRTVYVEPYVLCFTQSYVEVRTRFTGRLVQTVELAGAAYQARIGDELFLTARHGDRSSIHRLAVVAQEGFKEEIAVLHRASGSIAAAVATLDADPGTTIQPLGELGDAETMTFLAELDSIASVLEDLY